MLTPEKGKERVHPRVLPIVVDDLRSHRAVAVEHARERVLSFRLDTKAPEHEAREHALRCGRLEHLQGGFSA